MFYYLINSLKKLHIYSLSMLTIIILKCCLYFFGVFMSEVNKQVNDNYSFQFGVMILKPLLNILNH